MSSPHSRCREFCNYAKGTHQTDSQICGKAQGCSIGNCGKIETMKTLLSASFAILVFVGATIAAQTELRLRDGSVIKGEVSPLRSADAADVTVETEFGVIRVPLAKLTDQSRAAIPVPSARAGSTASTTDPRVKLLEARIRELEAENSKLRQQLMAQAQGNTQTPRSSFAPSASGGAADPKPTATHSISKSGKRHNSGCRYFGSGRPCGPSDGDACKICGG
jgi:hypothetical protein